VYSTNRNVNDDGTLIANGYNWPEFSREKLLTAMIVHHFRLFTMRAWSLTSGFNEDIANAVDYDMYLKLSEVGQFKHVNKICYNRVLHGENTSIKKLGVQKANHFKVVNQALKRQKVLAYEYLATEPDDDKSRKYTFNKCEAAHVPNDAPTGMGSPRSTTSVVPTC
jgi:chondroitin synthase